MMRAKRMLIVGAALATAAFAASTSAQTPNGAPTMAEVIHARQAHYKEIGGAMKGIIDEIKKPDPAVPAIQDYAKKMDAFAPQVITWFPTGSGPEAGMKTAAKAEIWQKPEEFKRQTVAFLEEAHKFDTVAMGGDIGKIRAEMPALGGTCRSCHQDFRVREQ